MKTNFFTIGNFMPKVLLLLFSALLFSCSAQDSFQGKDLVEMDKKISGSYQNSSSEGSINGKLWQFFNLKQNDSVVEINSVKNKLFVGFIDGSGDKHVITFEGKFRKKFFQFDLDYKTLLVPPLLMSIERRQVRLSIDKDSNLVVNCYQDNSGMILIIGAGNSGNAKYTFTKNN